MKKLIDDIMHDRRSDIASLPARATLRTMEFLWRILTACRNFLYDRSVLKTRDVPCRVISVGNLTVGGTGKTPVVVMIAKMLADAGYVVAVVSRGYGGRASSPVVVSDGVSVLTTPGETGDEPHIIASALPGVPVVVGKDRHQAAILAFERFRPRAILLDDGFQHRRLFRNIDIVTVDAGTLIGNEHLLPRGILRESPYGLKRAHAVIVTRFGDENRDRIQRTIRYFDRRVPIYWSGHKPIGLREPGTDNPCGIEWLDGKKIAALSNIAGPAQYHRLIRSLGAEIVMTETMPDHHRYSVEEITDITVRAVSLGAEAIVMTAKDERNLPGFGNVEKIRDLIGGTIRSYVLDIEASIGDEEERRKLFELVKPSG